MWSVGVATPRAARAHRVRWGTKFFSLMFSPSLPMQLMRVIGLQAFSWVWSLPGLGINTTFDSCHSLGTVPTASCYVTWSTKALPNGVLLAALSVL